MTIRSIFLLGVFLSLSIISVGQKIKYKDLFVLLNAKQFDQAEPFLKRYLVDNMDNPNALLFMGYILEEKALADDVLTSLSNLNNHSDSAVLYLDLAFKEIDEKELRKNDEYYQMYSRRDLRTGKFGLKLSDVQFDLEKRSKYLKDRKQRVLQLHEKFDNTKKIYSRCESLFKSISDNYKDKMEFFLRSDDPLKSDLKKLARRYDSLLISFNDYTTHLAGLGKTGHNQELDVQQIESFKHDGFAKADFIEDEIKVWDYKRWALVNLDLIENEIEPSRAALVKIDTELNDLREKLRKDSVDVTAEAKAIGEKALKLSIKKYDPSPMPLDVFSLKIRELNYGAYAVQTASLRDSSDLKLKRDLFKSDIKLLNQVDSVATILNKRNLDYDVENYNGFVKDAYGSANVLISLIKTTGDFAVSEKAVKMKLVANLSDAINWIVDAGDSIPVTAEAKSNTFFPISIVPEKYTFGIKAGDSVKNYFYTITPSRKPAIKTVHLADTVFKKENLEMVKGLSASPDGDNYFAVLYSERKVNEKIPAYIYQVATHGLVWSNKLMLDGIPGDLAFNEEDKSISVKVTNEAGSKIVVIDDKGKIVPQN